MPKLNLPEETEPRPRLPVRRPPDHRSRGAWKVAYADFVTALMALFIVLWMMGATQKVKTSVSGYFQDPKKFARTPPVRSITNAGEGLVVHRDNMAEIRKSLEQAVSAMPEFGQLRGQVKFSVTGDGLRIDLLETEQGMFFVSGGATPTQAGQDLLRVLAQQILQLPNRLVIEGHTDARPFRNASPVAGYSNWELAADRANAARRLLHLYGVRPEQVAEVRGYADQRLFNPQDRFDSRNRRVSIVVRFVAES